jgi:hypothetical protein
MTKTGPIQLPRTTILWTINNKGDIGIVGGWMITSYYYTEELLESQLELGSSSYELLRKLTIDYRTSNFHVVA